MYLSQTIYYRLQTFYKCRLGIIVIDSCVSSKIFYFLHMPYFGVHGHILSHFSLDVNSNNQSKLLLTMVFTIRDGCISMEILFLTRNWPELDIGTLIDLLLSAGIGVSFIKILWRTYSQKWQIHRLCLMPEFCECTGPIVLVLMYVNTKA